MDDDGLRAEHERESWFDIEMNYLARKAREDDARRRAIEAAEWGSAWRVMRRREKRRKKFWWWFNEILLWGVLGGAVASGVYIVVVYAQEWLR